jgi:hypothetical protein
MAAAYNGIEKVELRRLSLYQYVELYQFMSPHNIALMGI